MEATRSIVIKIGDRYFSYYRNKRVTMSWSLAGSKLFGIWDEASIKETENILLKKGYTPSRHIVGVLH